MIRKRKYLMRKQIDGQISLFDYIAEEEQKESKKQRVSKQKKEQGEELEGILYPVTFFKQCKNCWCSDCKHNEKLDAVPRNFLGEKKACPSCSFCLHDKKAEICEIGSYDNGCKLRASEEGIVEESEG